jgi:hypothetical protein
VFRPKIRKAQDLVVVLATELAQVSAEVPASQYVALSSQSNPSSVFHSTVKSCAPYKYQ